MYKGSSKAVQVCSTVDFGFWFFQLVCPVSSTFRSKGTMQVRNRYFTLEMFSGSLPSVCLYTGCQNQFLL